MKRITYILIILLMLFCLGATITQVSRKGAVVRRTRVAFGADVNDASETAVSFFGTLKRIVIDSAGTDTAFKVYLKDAASITLWSKTDCNSTDDPESLPLTMTDGSTTFLGIPHTGALTVEIDDANDLTDLDIYIYYE